jgi:ABC-type transport system involved in cytochrome c biogenesis ATPase subunit
MILGLARPDGGDARIAGKPFGKLDDPVRTVGAVLAGGAFHDGRSARSSLLATAAVAGLPDSRVDEVIELVGLSDAPGRRVGNYSLGMRQRLSLAQALLGEPQVLILDEPTNDLDPAGIKWLRETPQSLAHDQGKTVLLSSHILTEVRETGTMITYVGFAVFGLMIGVLCRSQAIAVGVAFGVLFIVDPILAAVTTYSEYTATASAGAMLDPDTHQAAQPSFDGGIALMVLYVVVLGAIALSVEQRRDVD